MLQQLLPKFKKKVNKELEERHRMLKENPGLLQLYKDLVITQIMKPEEFWEQHAPVNGVRAAGAGVPNLKVRPSTIVLRYLEVRIGCCFNQLGYKSLDLILLG